MSISCLLHVLLADWSSFDDSSRTSNIILVPRKTMCAYLRDFIDLVLLSWLWWMYVSLVSLTEMLIHILVFREQACILVLASIWVNWNYWIRRFGFDKQLESPFNFSLHLNQENGYDVRIIMKLHDIYLSSNVSSRSESTLL